ncbi:putative Zn-dependent protease [Pacificimonas flava]|nr:putative Zn-dependent protease [Pacificimonas flava]
MRTMTLIRSVLALMLAVMLAVRPAHAQSILRDAETEAWLHEMATPLAKAAGLDPRNVELVLINDPSLNAFVMTGQTIYVHSGTILQADNANQLQGIIAHELGHIAAGHSVRFGPEGMKGASSVSILSLLAAVGAIAAGAGEAGMAIMGLGQRAALGKVLAFNRQQESRTDQAGARYLERAGISGRGSIEFFEKIQNQEYRYAIPQDNDYMRTHPLSADRISALESLYRQSPYWDTPTDPKLEAQFERIKAKLFGFIEDPERTLRKYPESDTSAPARVARAYAWHKGAYPDQAAAETDALLAENPNDPYILELKGQVLLESGRPEDAVAPLERAIENAPDQPLIATLLGHALIASEDPDMLPRAIEVLRGAVAHDRLNPFAWYQLGIAYSQTGDEARAALASAEQHSMSRQPELAVRSAQMAMNGIPKGTPDWIRAQDILMVAQNEIEDGRD